MRIHDLGASLVRRWYVSIFGLLITAALAFGALTYFPATFEAKASMVLLPPKATVDQGGNPYLQLGGLTQVVDVITRSLNSQSANEAAAKVDPDARYLVAPDYATSGPILIITADAKTKVSTRAILESIKKLVPSTLSKLQTTLGISEKFQITSETVATDDEPITIRKTQIRAFIAAIGVGLLFSGFLVALVDSFLLRRAGRKRGQSGRPPVTETVVKKEDDRAKAKFEPNEVFGRDNRETTLVDQGGNGASGGVNGVNNGFIGANTPQPTSDQKNGRPIPIPESTFERSTRMRPSRSRRGSGPISTDKSG